MSRIGDEVADFEGRQQPIASEDVAALAERPHDLVALRGAGARRHRDDPMERRRTTPAASAPSFPRRAPRTAARLRTPCDRRRARAGCPPTRSARGPARRPARSPSRGAPAEWRRHSRRPSARAIRHRRCQALRRDRRARARCRRRQARAPARRRAPPRCAAGSSVVICDPTWTCTPTGSSPAWRPCSR